jgi:hypothetical protein
MSKELCGITYYSVTEAAEMLSIHKVTLRRYIKEGRVEATRIGRPYYITEQNLRQIFSKEPTAPASEPTASNLT